MVTRMLAVSVSVSVLAAALPMAVTPARAAPPPVRQLYIAPSGEDTGPGTLDRPFATLERAQRAVRDLAGASVVVNLRGGTYTLASPLRMSGDAGDSGAVYQAYGYGTARQEPVTISGGRTVSGWRPGRDGIWRADAGDLETRQLYVDGRRANRTTAAIPGTLTLTDTGYTTTSTIPRTWRAPGSIEFVYRYSYVEGRCGVAGVSGNTITMDQPCWDLARSLYGAEALASVYQAENSPSFLTRPGDWYLDRSRHELLYRPRPGEDMRRATVVAPVLESLVTGTGVRDLGFRGLTFAYATWLGSSEPAGFPAAWSMYLREDGLHTVPGAVTFHNAERVTLEGNRFTHLGGQGLELSKSSSHNVVSGNVFTDISDGGILMGVVPPDETGTNRGNLISDNWIHHIGVEYRAASGIWDTATQHTTIAHNQVDDVPYSGILSGPSDDLRGIMHSNRIVGNRVFHTNKLLDDGGGIYVRGEQGTSYADGLVIAGNAVTDSDDGEWGVGIYTDDSTNWATVDRNAVYDYVAAIGGCSEEWGDRPVRNVRYRDNHWDDAVPDWVPRREYPGAWVPANPDNPEEGCGDPHDLQFGRNTLLDPENPARACAADPACVAILASAGPRPHYRRTLGLS
ncbi:right-handed parallel beta-helix repeat-containing protein [Phytohabitans aurantiacus]|uniref:Right handed beta helix domain-containing protein n=1 Tax=Phytohabitans aurantiacus TaxID=3016789 RepID=A0ABQ5QL57_9ACTN|nr:right-handed parallel beta-helix repeat-containing protein [Phytohabitans aurantiacus]GLH95425.1 hypothetical protein Pa4123_06970 [Phytohabitans aurantiacus]